MDGNFDVMKINVFIVVTVGLFTKKYPFYKIRHIKLSGTLRYKQRTCLGRSKKFGFN